MGSNEILIIVGGIAVAAVAYVGNVGGFKTWADGALKGGGGSCQDLCARKECSTYLSRCGTKGCGNCTSCSKLCSLALCGDYRTLGCSISACNRCAQITGVIKAVNPNCKKVGNYTVWKSTGCLTPTSRPQSGLEYAGIGTCSQIAAQFVKRYRCGGGGGAAKLAQAFAYPGFDNVTMA